jgi:hypothetical protein
VRGDRLVARSHEVGIAGDDRGDLKRRPVRVGVDPERRRSRGVIDRDREREAAVGQGHGPEPVAELGRGRRGRGEDVLEHLERVERRAGLARG